MALIKIIKQLNQNKVDEKKRRKDKSNAQFVGLCMAKLLKQRINRYGRRGDITFIHSNKIRHSFTFATEITQRKSVVVLKDFLLQTCGILEFKEKLKSCLGKCHRINKILKDKLVTRMSKIEVLESYWDKMIGVI